MSKTIFKARVFVIAIISVIAACIYLSTPATAATPKAPDFIKVKLGEINCTVGVRDFKKMGRRGMANIVDTVIRDPNCNNYGLFSVGWARLSGRVNQFSQYGTAQKNGSFFAHAAGLGKLFRSRHQLGTCQWTDVGVTGNIYNIDAVIKNGKATGIYKIKKDKCSNVVPD
jgi:hypothetical protein